MDSDLCSENKDADQTAQLICAFCRICKIRLSHDAARIRTVPGQFTSTSCPLLSDPHTERERERERTSLILFRFYAKVHVNPIFCQKSCVRGADKPAHQCRQANVLMCDDCEHMASHSKVTQQTCRRHEWSKGDHKQLNQTMNN